MTTTFRSKLSYALSLAIVLALLLAPLAVMAAATGTPLINDGYDLSVDYKAAVKFRSFNNDKSSTIETVLGYDGFTEGSTTIDFGQNTGWKASPAVNPITFSYDPDTGFLSTTIAAKATYSADYYIGDLGPLNYIKIEIAKSTGGVSKVEFKNVTIDGFSLGSFIGQNNSTKQWNIRGLTFTEGFEIKGDVLVTSNVAGGDNARIEITVGHYDVLGPVTSNVAVSPLPVYLNGQATVSATADDSTTYGSNIDFAEFNLDGGAWSDWSLMAADDGTYDSVIENVSADFTAAINVGKHTTCVRATDNFWIANTGEPVCQDFIVTYVFDGFFDPIDMEQINLTKAGQAVPVKWRLTDALGLPIDNPASFAGLYSYPVACNDLTEPVDAIEEYASGDSGLQYLGDGNWQFNWKTPKTYATSCRAMYVKFNSGTTSDVVVFQFK